MDLATFLEARIADDEAPALAVGGSPEWQHDGSGQVFNGGSVCFLHAGPFTRMAHYIARHDPARVLREVDAKRKIVAEHAREPGMLPPSCVRCCETNTAQYPQRWEALMWPCPTVRAVVAVWSDHEDYDPAWKE